MSYTSYPSPSPQPRKGLGGWAIAGIAGAITLAVVGIPALVAGGSGASAGEQPATVISAAPSTAAPAPAEESASKEPAAAPTDGAEEKAATTDEATDQTSADETTADETAADGSNADKVGPKRQQEFVAIVTKGIEQGNEADNDLKMGRAMTKRDKALKREGFTSAKSWRGTVVTLDSNGDGHGILGIEIAPGVVVTTWNNAFSDIGDNTLIKSDKLMDRLAELSEGDEVVFSGTFIQDTEIGAPRYSGLTKIGKLLEPEFIFRFSSVKPA